MKKNRISPYQFLFVAIVMALASGPALSFSMQGLASSGSSSFKLKSAPATVSFDTCLRDNITGNIFMFNSTAGNYTFIRCSDGFTFSGTGTAKKVNSVKTLIDFKTDRRISANFNTGQLTGSATIYILTAPGVWQLFSIKDTTSFGTICSCQF